MLSFSILCAAQHEKLRKTQPPHERPAVLLAGDREATLVEAAQEHSKATVCEAHGSSFSPVVDWSQERAERPPRPVSMVGRGFEEVKLG